MSNIFNENGSYNQTNWETGDMITADKLNKIEEALSEINDKAENGADVDLSDYATKNELDNKADKDHVHSEYVTSSALDLKQDKLVSGSNIKTINGQNILGSGDIVISDGESVSTTNKLEGKSFICIGDSFVKGHTLSESQTWAYKLATRNNMTYHKHAVNGVSLTYKSGQSSTALINSIDDFLSGVSAADYVIVLAGHNDANPDLNGGSAVPIGENTDKINTTFKGALNLLIDKLYVKYPTAKLLFLTPFNRRGIEEPYVEAMKEICGVWCIPCFDNYHSGGICFQNAAQAAKYELSTTLHLNEAGQERVSYLYESLLVNELPISYSLDLSIEESLEISIDDELNSTSENPVQNKVIAAELAQVEETLQAYISQLEERIALLESGNGATMYTITYNLTNVKSSSALKTVIEGNQYTTKLSAEEGYVMGTVTVTMGGTDITSTAYGDGVVGIPEVNGDIVITATAAAELITWDVSHWKLFSDNRAGLWTPEAIPSGAVIMFSDDSIWSTYKYAIGTNNNEISSTWIGGGYQDGAYTVTNSAQYTIMVARQDNAVMSQDELTTIASIIGYLY